MTVEYERVSLEQAALPWYERSPTWWEGYRARMAGWVPPVMGSGPLYLAGWNYRDAIERGLVPRSS